MELYFYQVKKHGLIIHDREFRTKEEMEKAMKKRKEKYASDFVYHSGKRIFDGKEFIEV